MILTVASNFGYEVTAQYHQPRQNSFKTIYMCHFQLPLEIRRKSLTVLSSHSKSVKFLLNCAGPWGRTRSRPKNSLAFLLGKATPRAPPLPTALCPASLGSVSIFSLDWKPTCQRAGVYSFLGSQLSRHQTWHSMPFNKYLLKEQMNKKKKKNSWKRRYIS